MTARDAHVMMAGRRDGSVLAMFDVAPLLVLVGDPDQLFQPGLVLLGVAHRACADLARQHLEARQVELPDELPQLVGDDGTGELPALHRPPEPGRCAFCLETDLTDEHIWPQWMSQLLGADGFTISSPNGKRQRRSIDPTTRVCRTCNNRWLAVLEQDVKPLPSHIVWIGAYRDATHVAWPRHYGLHVGISADEPPNAFGTTFTAFRVVFQVFGHFTPGRARLDDRRRLAAALTPIWPPLGWPVDWPPRGLAFGDASLLELAESLTKLATSSAQGQPSGGQPADP